RRGIRVILDLVMNHTSNEHPWFLESASSTASPFRDWYVWSASDPGWRQPWGGNDPSWHPRNGAWYYGAFWSGMPDLNFRNPAAKEEMLRLARHWLTAGADGYRLDATRYLVENGPGESSQADTPETHQVLRELSAEVRRVKPEAILIAENTVGTEALAKYYASVPMNFNFPLAEAIVEGVRDGEAERIRETLEEVIRSYPAGVIDTPFLTNHDQTRVATVLGGHPGKLRSAAAILLTLPGTPFLYYGEEVGMQNGPTSADESKRTPMPWTSTGGFTSGAPWRAYSPGIATNNVAVQMDDPGSLLAHYRDWIAARKKSVALQKGTITALETGSQVFAYVRESPAERVLVAHNVSGSTATVTSPAPLERIHADRGVDDSSAVVSLPPHSSGAWRMR
ncbi:MAG TPA: alpha-amylase family glycosyl hydrolase, partial [Thermoanaerobaculia bacterium]|nr:alpha-amylase family glycosyl hydrolase [Thermoanaerobaculia bacterium]